MTRFEQGRVELRKDHVSLPTLARWCIELMEAPASDASIKGVQLKLDVDQKVEALGDCLGDKRRLQQLMLNLLHNAVKFTLSGGCVSLCLAAQPASDRPSLPPSTTLPLLLTVIDTGIGISEKDLKLIFLKYTKAEDASGVSGVWRESSSTSALLRRG